MILANLAAVKKARMHSRARHPPPLRAASDAGDAALWARLLAEAIIAETRANQPAPPSTAPSPVVSRS